MSRIAFTVQDVRQHFTLELSLTDPGDMLEITGVSFTADEETIFGQVNRDYVARELAWYESRSLYIDDIPLGAPKIWRDVADRQGKVNSNYGFLFRDVWNHSQFDQIVKELRRDPASRRAVAVYTRPTMHWDAVANGMQDFVCTNAVQYLVRDGEVHAVVQMRSNDAVFGYRNDWAWQRHALGLVAEELSLPVGSITWQAGSLHVYPRHRWLVEHYAETGEWLVPVNRKKEEA